MTNADESARFSASPAVKTASKAFAAAVNHLLARESWARERFKTKPDDFFIAPTAIADEAWHVANQPRSAWSFNVEVRPYGETW